ncbi:MAG: transposase [Candidatus Manganitrophaceae bacterium]
MRRAARLQFVEAAYRQPTYELAAARLVQIQHSLQRENPSATASLSEGMEETLTLHRLGISGVLALSFSTTNVLESINAQLGRLTRNVTRWRNGDQKQRWVASALLDIEPRLRRVKGYRALPQLRAAILREQAGEGASSRIGDTKIVDPGANVAAA